MSARLIIYFHYDPRGQADSACRFAVQALCRHARDFLLVTNGSLDPDSRAWAQSLGIRLLERPNAGYDVGAYRDALLMLGRQALDRYGEVVLMNYTLAGPVCPLQGLFSTMEARTDLDFWGLSRHYAMHSRRFGGKKGVVPEHIQSHFIAVRPRMYDDFWQYWQTMPPVTSYEQSIVRHETRFTRYFADKGYRWDTFVPGEDWRGVFLNPIMACPRELLRRYACPFFKRRSFFTPYADELRRTDGLAAVRLYEYLKTGTDYPVDELIAALLPTQSLGQMARNLHWRYLLPDSAPQSEPRHLAADALEKSAMLEPGQVYVLDVPPLPLAGTTAYYAKSCVWTPGEQIRAAALFDNRERLGFLAQATPPFAPLGRALAACWRRDFDYVQKRAGELGLSVPLDAEFPPPLPAAGGILVRGDAFPAGLPPLVRRADWWLIALYAQQNGYAVGVAVSKTEALACGDVLDVCRRETATPAGAAKVLARACKRRLLHHGED